MHNLFRFPGSAAGNKDKFKTKQIKESSDLKTDSLKKMDNLKLLQLNFVHLAGSYENFSKDLRWLCWLGFHLTTIPSDLSMGNVVALDMSYSCLEEFEPPVSNFAIYLDPFLSCLGINMVSCSDSITFRTLNDPLDLEDE